MIYIEKGKKLFCDGCHGWLATTKTAIDENITISEETFDANEGVLESGTCPNCHNIIAQIFVNPVYWVDDVRQDREADPIG